MAFDLNAYYREQCNASTPIIRLSQNQSATIELVIRDEDGNPLDLESLAPTPQSSSSGNPIDATVRLAAKPTFSSSTVQFNIVGTILSSTNGSVSFELTETETNNVGLFVAGVGVYYGSTLVHQQMLYIELMANVFSDTSVNGPITIPEVRLDIMDVCPAANYLIDELEFTDVEIMHAMRKAVDFFNETPPPLGDYTYQNFPYRAHWLKGTVGFLLQMIAHRYRRNALAYSAGGVSVSDQEKWREYDQVGKTLEVEYKDWVTKAKVTLNIRRGYGRIGPSPYGVI